MEQGTDGSRNKRMRMKREISLHFRPLFLGGLEEGGRWLRHCYNCLNHPIDKLDDGKDSHHASNKEEGQDGKNNRVGGDAKGQHDVVSVLS